MQKEEGLDTECYSSLKSLFIINYNSLVVHC